MAKYDVAIKKAGEETIYYQMDSLNDARNFVQDLEIPGREGQVVRVRILQKPSGTAKIGKVYEEFRGVVGGPLEPTRRKSREFSW